MITVTNFGRFDLSEEISGGSLVEVAHSDRYMVIACKPGWTEQMYDQALTGTTRERFEYVGCEYEDDGTEVLVFARMDADV